MNASLYEIAHLVQGVVIGDEKIVIHALSPINNIRAGSLVFADNDDNLQLAENSDAAAILVNTHHQSETKSVIQVPHPLKAFIQLLTYFHPEEKANPEIHPTAIIADDVILGEQVSIGPYVIIEAGSKLGDRCVIKGHVNIGKHVSISCDTVIHPHVTIYPQTQIGARVAIHASSVIGSDGFGYTFTDGRHLKIPHVGQVIIEDDVEIGASTTIDRATLGATVIGAGTKIDNLVQIAHSVKLGQHNILCAFTGIAGSTTSGNHVIFAANVGVSDHVRIDDGVILGARTGVPPKKHLIKGNVYLGNPSRPKDKTIEQELSVTRIPLMSKNMRALGEKLAALTARIEQLEEAKK